jgi:hypothetical protein
MRVVSWLAGFFRADVEQARLEPLQRVGGDAYELVDRLPRGPARRAAWNAYVLQTYADKLIAAGGTSKYVRADTAEIASEMFGLVGLWLERASELAADPAAPSTRALPEPIPHWHTPVRCREQLVGMREALVALYAYVAYDLRSVQTDDTALARLRGELATIEQEIETVDILWIARPPAELRGGIGDALCNGLDKTFSLGQVLAAGRFI